MDVVAHDKHGRPIRDLKPEELQIVDDGNAVKITGLRLVTSDDISAKTDRHPNDFRAISLVFDALQGDANSIALRAAEYLLKEAAEKNFYFSVWRLTSRLELAQTLTNDQAGLKRALQATLKPRSGRPQPGESLTQQSLPMPEFVKPFAAQLPTTAALATRIARDENVTPFLAGLLALIRQQSSFPGRKTIVYFSDGQMLASLTASQLQSVVGAANRARVSIYSVDPSGVKPANDLNAGLFTMHGNSAPLGPNGPPTASNGLAQPVATMTPAAATSTMNTNMTMSAQVRDHHQGDYGLPLKQIANQTGGSYISETNNAFDALRRLTEDAGSYYEATYAPGKIDYDGHFRPVQVRVTRPHIAVQARAGYYSVSPKIGTDLRPFELPLLKALARPGRTQLIPFAARVFRFGPEQNGSRAELVVELPFDEISYQNDLNRRLCKLHFSILALIKGADREIVQKMSEDLPLQTALENSQQLRQSTHLFDRTFTAPPGKYTLDVAVCDQTDHRLSTTSVPFELSPQPKGLGLSELTLVKRLEPMPQETDAEELLRYRGYRVVPELQSEGASLSSQLFFTIYPDPKSASKPQVAIELRQHGSVLAESALRLPEFHEGEPIPVLASFSKFSMPPGSFELWAKVTEGDVSREQKLDATIMGNGSLARSSQLSGATEADGPPQLSSLVEPKLVSNGQKPSDAEIQRILDAGRQRAIDYKNALPNFSCTLITRRSIDKTGNSAWKQRDTVTQLLRYVDGREDYKIIDQNGARPGIGADSTSDGVWSSGEFGEFLDSVFSPKAQAQFEWQGKADVDGVQTDAFKYHISRRHSLYSLRGKNWSAAVAYHGFVYIDPNTMAVRRVSIEAEDIPRNFPIRESALTVDYIDFSIGGEQYLLPASATLYVREGKRHLAKNEKQFRDYRRYAGQSTIKFN